MSLFLNSILMVYSNFSAPVEFISTAYPRMRSVRIQLAIKETFHLNPHQVVAAAETRLYPVS